MKKPIIMVALLAAGYIGWSQSNVQLGLKAGANFSAWAGKESDGTSYYNSFYAGGLAVFPVSSAVAIQPEILFSGEGTKFSGGRYKFQYIRLPLLLQYRHVSGFHVESGPQIGVLMTAKLREKKDEPEKDIKEMVKPVETSWVIAIGYRLPAGIGLDVRHTIGLSRIGGASEIKSSVIGVGLSYLFKNRR